MLKTTLKNLFFPFANNVLAHWPCNEVGEDGTVYDVSGNGNDLTVSDTPSKPYFDGSGIRFDGTNYAAQRPIFKRNIIPCQTALAISKPSMLIDPGVNISESLTKEQNINTVIYFKTFNVLLYGFVGNRGQGESLGNELLVNGDFESGLTGWTLVQGSGSITDEGSVVHSGSHSLKLVSGGAGDVILSKQFSFAKGSILRVSGWVKRSSSGHVSCGIYTHGVPAIYIDEGFIDLGIIGTGWEYVTLNIGLPTWNWLDELEFVFTDHGFQDGDSCHYDDFSIKEILDVNEEDGCSLYSAKSGNDQNCNFYPMVNWGADPTDIFSYEVYLSGFTFRETKTFWAVIILDESNSSGYLFSRNGSGIAQFKLFFNATNIYGRPDSISLLSASNSVATSDPVFFDRGVPVFIAITIIDDSLYFYRNGQIAGIMSAGIGEGWAPIVFGSYFEQAFSKIIDGGDAEEYIAGLLPRFTLCMGGVLDRGLAGSEILDLFSWVRDECEKRNVCLTDYGNIKKEIEG